MNVSNIMFRSESNDPTNVTITCINGVIISCSNVSNFKVKGLLFKLNPQLISQVSSALNVVKSREISIISSMFQGSHDLNETLGRALYLRNSNVAIAHSVFEEILEITEEQYMEKAAS